MDFKSLTLAFVFNSITQGIPIFLAIYFALRRANDNIFKSIISGTLKQD